MKTRLSTAEVIKNAEEIFHGIRWSNGIVVCPYCGSVHIKEYDGYKYKCNHCKNRFSDRTKTLMHGSKLSIKVWLQAVYEITIDNFIPSTVLAEKLGINQKSAWLLRMKLDYCLPQDRWLLEGCIAQDEMYVGGCLSNYHYGRKLGLLRANGLLEEDRRDYTKNAIFTLNQRLKQPVYGMNDGSKIVLYAIPNPIAKEYLHQIFKKHVVGDSVTISDESGLYYNWEKITGSKLYTNNHHNNQYNTEDGLTSNAIENTFSWFKRGFNGRITHCKYTQLYLNEFVFRYNTRHLGHIERFRMMLGETIGKYVTYKQIKAYNQFGEYVIKTKRKRHIYTREEIRRLFDECGWVLESFTIGKTTYYRRDFE